MLLTPCSGSTARLISKYRPVCPIIMVTRNDRAARVSGFKLSTTGQNLTLFTVLASIPRRLPFHLPREEARLRSHRLARGRRPSSELGDRAGHQAGHPQQGRHGGVRAGLERRHGTHEHAAHRPCRGVGRWFQEVSTQAFYHSGDLKGPITSFRCRKR